MMLFSAPQKPAKNSLKLLQRIANNDRTAAEECLAAYGDMVWTLAKEKTASIEEAEDAAQKIFLDLWQYAGRYDEKKCAEDFLCCANCTTTFDGTLEKCQTTDFRRCA